MSSATQTALYATALVVSILLVLCGVVGLLGSLWLSLALFGGLLALSWRHFDGGRHPCFLFLCMLLLFQMGRLVGYVFGVTRDPFDVVVQTAIPITVSPASCEITLFLILISAIIIYTVCAWNAPAIVLRPGWEQSWLSACYILFALSFPFVLWKNYIYFEFIRSHGGYLAIFTDSEAIAKSAGTIVRVMSLVASNTFLLLYLIERRGGRLAIVTSAYLSTSVLELAIGLRGKVFLFLITLWFLHNLKTAKRFKLSTLAIVGLAGSIAAVAVSGFREMRSTAFVGPAGFIAGQGISMGVTQVAVQYRPLFRPHVGSYLGNEILQAFYPGSHFGQGQIFDNDISVFLNPAAFKNGFGTGSSYLAEAYIAGGIVGVLAISVLLGFVLRGLHRAGANFLGAVAVGILLPSIIYMPRAQLFSPIAASLKTGLVFLFMLPCLWVIRIVFYEPESEVVADDASPTAL